MIIGSGLVARAFLTNFGHCPKVWIYAAGVSNSSCSDPREFERERRRLSDALCAGNNADAFVYFSTCSVKDPNAGASAYVRHKIAMEKLVSEHVNFVVVRLPQLAGRTPNPYTLLNYLYARVSRSERFSVWKKATRNIIDVDDVACIVMQLLEIPETIQTIVNVANPVCNRISDIVAVMEKVTGKRAITDEVDDGAAYEIDTSQIVPIISRLGLSFDSEYILRVIQKYYGQVGDK